MAEGEEQHQEDNLNAFDGAAESPFLQQQKGVFQKHLEQVDLSQASTKEQMASTAGEPLALTAACLPPVFEETLPSPTPPSLPFPAVSPSQPPPPQTTQNTSPAFTTSFPLPAAADAAALEISQSNLAWAAPPPPGQLSTTSLTTPEGGNALLSSHSLPTNNHPPSGVRRGSVPNLILPPSNGKDEADMSHLAPPTQHAFASMPGTAPTPVGLTPSASTSPSESVLAFPPRNSLPPPKTAYASAKLESPLKVRLSGIPGMFCN